MSESIVYDLTVVQVGEQPFGDFYAVPLSECPVCHRTGQQYTEYDDGMWMHVLCFQTDDHGETIHAPVWVAEYCNIDDNRQVISEPAATMRGKPLIERLREAGLVDKNDKPPRTQRPL